MIVTYGHLDMNAIARRWWILVLRGLIAVAFGVVAIVWPGLSLLGLVLFWGGYAMVDGLAAGALAVRAARAGRRWGWLLAQGLVTIGCAVLTVLWPAFTAQVLLMMIATWAIATGVLQIGAAVELRKQLRGEWTLGLGGAVSIVFGILLIAFPTAGAVAVMTMAGIHAVVFGALMTTLGLRIHRELREAEATELPRGSIA